MMVCYMKMVLKLIKRDIMNGYYQTRYKMVFWVCFIVSSVILYANNISNGILNGSYLEVATLGDLIQYIYLGPYDLNPAQNSFFRLPVIWLGYHLMVAYLVGDYIQDDLSGSGQIFLIYSRKRLNWWVSKYVWTICFVVSLYFVSYILLFIAAVLFNFHFALSITPQLSIELFSNDYSITSHFSFLATYVFLPLLTSCVVSTIQVILILVVKPVLSYIFVISLFVISIYVPSPLLITNFAIPAHNSIYVDSGVSTEFGFVLLFLLLIALFAIGAFLLEHKDFLERIE